MSDRLPPGGYSSNARRALNNRILLVHRVAWKGGFAQDEKKMGLSQNRNAAVSFCRHTIEKSSVDNNSELFLSVL